VAGADGGGSICACPPTHVSFSLFSLKPVQGGKIQWYLFS
jgi:hypothetical protein